MAALTRLFPDTSWITVDGPFKREVIMLYPASGASVSQDDTFTSKLANPLIADIFLNGDNAAGAYGITCTTTSNSKTITINVTNGSIDADRQVVAVVYGY